jgi:hypothetical protein
MKWKLPIRAKHQVNWIIQKQKASVRHCSAPSDIVRPCSKQPHHSIETPYWTLSGPAGHCPTPPDFVQILNPSPTASFLRELYTPPPPMALSSWPLLSPVEQAHFLHSKRQNSLSPRASIPSSCLGIEWSKDSSSLCDSPPQARLSCWIFILHAYYSWSIAPR